MGDGQLQVVDMQAQVVKRLWVMMVGTGFLQYELALVSDWVYRLI